MKRVLALGFFDGVHIGHLELLRRADEVAQELNITSTALTFDKHPLSVVNSRPVPLLCNNDNKEKLIREIVSEVLFLPFTDGMSRMSWRDYIKIILVRELQAVHIVVGDDFTFGYMGEGTPEKLEEELKLYNITCDIIPEKTIRGVRVSSTYIRKLIADGNIPLANEFLGRRYSISGVVTKGQGLAKSFGFPTANLAYGSYFPGNFQDFNCPPQGDCPPQVNNCRPQVQVPFFGVYKTEILCKSKLYKAITNVGCRPTVDKSGSVVIESALIDFSDDLYGEEITVYFENFLRPEKKFNSIDKLKEQIKKDIKGVQL